MPRLDEIKLPLSIESIKEIIPHRYPFLLVDRVTEITTTAIKGYKNVSVGEPYFQGHFPEFNVMPGVLIVEALAQISCIQQMVVNDYDSKIGLFAGIEKVRFKAPVTPGDRLDLESEIIWERKGMGKCKASAYVGDKLCCSGEFTFALISKENLK
jgi:3-hydroxyacyl-[acyl-carrier-protein] dehydratase